MKPGLYIGLLSGTSMDGVDAALVDFGPETPTLVDALTLPYPDALHSEVAGAIAQHANLNVNAAGALDVLLGRHFAAAAKALVQNSGVEAKDIIAIGSHGQTICHAPQNDPPFSLQLGDGNLIAQLCKIDVVADFRRRDIACGGQAAPLAPLIHAALMRSPEINRAVVNIGGIANISLLSANLNDGISGFDTGPGNCLLDENCKQHLDQAYDRDGQWAASGLLQPAALRALLSEPWFDRVGPKSTGREHFHSAWVTDQLRDFNLKPPDLQATLSQLTAETIASAIDRAQPDTGHVLVCGGGVHNHDLMERLQQCMGAIPVDSSQNVGVDPDWVEAQLFAWLAMQHVEQHRIDTRSITGARHRYVPGALYRG